MLLKKDSCFVSMQCIDQNCSNLWPGTLPGLNQALTKDPVMAYLVQMTGTERQLKQISANLSA
jgi:hypothetical protein